VLITLAWMSIQASVTLAALLTALLFPWAIWTARRSPTLAGMTLAMLGMVWRGEAWKTVYLRVADQPCQSLQQRPKTVSICQVSGVDRVDSRSVPQYAAFRFRGAATQFGHRKPLRSVPNAFQAPWRPLSVPIPPLPHTYPQGDLITTV
jgi:hypothetical protein